MAINRLTAEHKHAWHCLSELDASIESMNKEHRKAVKDLDDAKKEERSQQDKLDEEAKELEKMSNKQSMLIKKVSFSSMLSVQLSVLLLSCIIRHCSVQLW